MMKKNLIYVVVLTVAVIALISFALLNDITGAHHSLAFNLAFNLAGVAIASVLGVLMGKRIDIIFGKNFGPGKRILISMGWLSHCVFYSVLITVAVIKIIPKIFS